MSRTEGKLNPQITDAFVTKGGVRITRTVVTIPVVGAIEPVIEALDSRRGVVLASSYEYPGRYTRWDMGFVDPPLELLGYGRRFVVRALNERGSVLLPQLRRALLDTKGIASARAGDDLVEGFFAEPVGRVPEEERSRRPTLFTVLRAIVDLFAAPEEPHLGLYGAFGYDLVFQFES